MAPTIFARGKFSKKRKSSTLTQVYDRDIICLPFNHPNNARVFAFPRGKVRVNLGRQGLIGKIRLDSNMSEDEIFSEISSCFLHKFGEEFSFKILQSAGVGSKSLVIPALSNNYEWKAKEVANSGGSRAIYVWALTELTFEVTQVKKSMLFGD